MPRNRIWNIDIGTIGFRAGRSWLLVFVTEDYESNIKTARVSWLCLETKEMVTVIVDDDVDSLCEWDIIKPI